jgi:hypothetical protein
MKWIHVLLSLMAMAQAQENIRFIEERDEFTDADTSRVVVYADEQPRYGRANILVWRCDGISNYELFVANDEFLTNSGSVPVIFRFDETPAVSERWNHSTTGVAAFNSSPEARHEFSLSAVAANRVIVGVTDYRGVRYSYTFRLSGLANVLDRLACFSLDGPPEPITVVNTRIFAYMPIKEAYERVKDVVAGEEFTEDVNVMYFDGFTLRFWDSGVSNPTLTILYLDGTNQELYERIRAAFD